MTNKTREAQGLRNRYGHLLGEYVDHAHADYATKQEREEEARNRYGHLLDYAKPDYKIHEDIIRLNDMCRKMSQQKAEEYEQANRRMHERIEREKREEQERISKNNVFVEFYLEKKKAEQEVAAQKRREAEREQNMLDSIRKLVNIRDEMSEKVAKTNAMLERDKQRRKEHEEKMEWYRRQEKK